MHAVFTHTIHSITSIVHTAQQAGNCVKANKQKNRQSVDKDRRYEEKNINKF